MRSSKKRREFLGWFVFLAAGFILAVFGKYDISTKKHNVFFIALFLIAIGIVLFFGRFYRQDSLRGPPSGEDTAFEDPSTNCDAEDCDPS
jgi:hypothetical protein